ncbi:potassium transporter TrkG [Lawsonibacter faecis]|uniref:Potassium uptake protein, TrkH family n=1 Tax=Lawsonibacter faecis TaxID=2763052 RepID=A0A8J6JA90_9FIRM|nr:potassium uptake protein, TrkH family [Lawsonibacter faecis]MTQ95774.1 potassium uptake protein, TrkH family [Pseudoflavonifractor sp. BIOML-A16]MTR05751.1 potassium uptake protein, TrkH family [Pseudoflavonifractor sp. BIOML-A15]MTR13084.1 potassium uptake protein, TrkH family [Pseudoflavonifractor sp. BIOML-A17]MTR19967.1 potassium uptake protein, TrkH family [Pseudoflavonifractor sp. BIOML-A19]MTR34075.1 potassium uptake protein, TrkH family [Pseudoflavonifractor sp. BIOML-A14]MTR35092.
MIKRISLWLRDVLIKKKSMNATRIVAGGFAAIILLGTLLLMLPFASKSGESAGFLNSLFTATSATCVTGLIPVDTGMSWTFFGQLVIIALIQLGGLGFMTVITMVSFLLRRRIGLSERLIMVSTLNLNDMDGVVRVVRHALIGTFTLEGAAAVLLSFRFVPQFGLLGGIWRGIFHAISAFCNAGFDLVGGKFGAFTSLEGYNDDPYVLCIIMALIVIGGLGFFVWEDIVRARSWKGLSLYSKMVLSITAALLLGGALFFFCAEYSNPETFGNMPVWQKALNAMFQSVTLRTAGFASFNQGGLKDSSIALSCVLMLIGGSSGSTAGGLKTVTAAVLLLGLRSNLAGREQVTIRGRAISYRKVMDAMTLALILLVLFLTGSIVISLADSVPYLHAAFETASALGTVGVTVGITPGLSPLSHVMLICMMYLGRIGVFSFSIAFLTRSRYPAKIKYPDLNVMIG